MESGRKSQEKVPSAQASMTSLQNFFANLWSDISLSFATSKHIRTLTRYNRMPLRIKKGIFLNIFFTGVHASEAWCSRRPISGGAGIAMLHRVTACGTLSNPFYQRGLLCLQRTLVYLKRVVPCPQRASFFYRWTSSSHRGPLIPTDHLLCPQRGLP